MSSKSILAMSDEEILSLKPDLVTHDLSQAEVEHIFRCCEAFWMHGGNPKKPHVQLTANNHSDGYINCAKVFEHPNLRLLLARQIVHRINLNYRQLFMRATDWVVGSDKSATKLAGDVANLLGCRHGVMHKDDQKQQHWRGEGIDNKTVVPRQISDGELVLQIEELMTTSFTAVRLREGIRAAHPGQTIAFANFIPVLMHRSAVKEVDGDPILVINSFNIKNWTKDQCPKCKAGSRPIEDPKKRWIELTT